MKPKFRLRGIAAFLVANMVVILVVAAIMRPDVARSYVRGSSGGADPFSLIRIDTTPVNPLDDRPTDRSARDEQLRTQMQLITSPNVLAAVVVDPHVASLDPFARSPNPEQTLREHLEVSQVPESELIRIASRGLDGKEGRSSSTPSSAHSWRPTRSGPGRERARRSGSFRITWMSSRRRLNPRPR